ncbi:MAG: hypothetical protein JNL34_07490 [Anaerolineae bacterium]|nr:hypothetical protein [Anaerolineae bacterium]
MKTNRTSRNYQSGQAIFVIALVMVGLIGALGLAVDGGGMAFLYRDAQNAADAAALAAAYAACAGGDNASVTNAATRAAADNGFVTGGTTTVNVTRDSGNANIITVSVGAVKPAYFVQLVYRNGLNVTARATSQCTPGGSGGNLPAMWSSGPVGGGGTSCHTVPGGVCASVEAGRLRIEGDVVSGQRQPDWSSGAGPSFTTGTISYTAPGTVPFRPATLANMDLSQFRAGGSVYERATNRVIHTGNWSLTPTAGTLSQVGGLHYVNGNVNLNFTNVSTSTIPPFTVVATGTINIVNFRNGLNAYIDDVLAYTTYSFTNPNACDSNRVININGGGDSHGIVYSPNGQTEVLYNGGTWVGALAGKYVDWWPNTSTTSVLRSLPTASPPVVALVS